jgi:hypothetical protein
VYRTIELADGWNGRIISTEVYFSALNPISSRRKIVILSKLDVLDGAMVTMAMYALNIAHPGFLLPEQKPGSPPSSSYELA